MDGEENIKSQAELLEEAQRLLDGDELTQAQTILDGIEDKTAEYHYVQSCLYKKKGWVNEERKQLKFALKKDPENEKCKEALAALEEYVKSEEYKTVKKKNRAEDAAECCLLGSCECCGSALCEAICDGCG